jgi:hypothetical protein
MRMVSQVKNTHPVLGSQLLKEVSYLSPAWYPLSTSPNVLFCPEKAWGQKDLAGNLDNKLHSTEEQ